MLGTMIFINYRRDDSRATAGRLHERLVQSFGQNNLFLDVDDIPPGVDFVNHLNSQLAACDLFLAVIGPHWLDARNEKGDRRLDATGDFVAIEIAAALARDIRVIPVLVDGARMPKVSDLPESLKPMARRQAIDLRNDHFGRDAESLIEKIREALKEKSRETRSDEPIRVNRWRAAAGVLVALLLGGWIGVFAMGLPLSVGLGAQPDTRALMSQLETEFRKREYDGAIAIADAIIQLDPKNALAFHFRGTAYLNRGVDYVIKSDNDRAVADHDRAIADYDKAIQLDRKDARVFINRGIAYSNKGKHDRAIADFNEAILVDPKNSDAFARAGDAYAKRGNNDQAIDHYSQAIRLDPKNAVVFVDRGAAYLRKDDRDRALADYDEAIRLDPKNARAFVGRGEAYVGKGDNDRALADYDEAIRLDPKNADAFLKRGLAYTNKGDHGQAITNYTDAIRLSPKNIEAFCSRGRAKLRMNDASGHADISKAIELKDLHIGDRVVDEWLTCGRPNQQTRQP
jgi:tetratricopeptide (TPR) repeat protein